MATIAQLLIIAESHLGQARGKDHSGFLTVETEIAASQAASLLAIARLLNHIVDHGIPEYPHTINKVLPRLENIPSDNKE